MYKKWGKPNCPICETTKHFYPFWQDVTTWEYPGQFTYIECKKCSLVFQSPRVHLKNALSYYPSKSYWGRDIRKLKKSQGWEKERKQAYGFLYKGIFRRKTVGSILDVGSGLGLFLSRFKEVGWRVQGTDIAADVARYSQKVFGVPVTVGDVLKINLPKRFYDVITMNQVFEHLYKPRGTLRKIHKLLKDDGLLVIAVPNLDGLGRYLFGKNWFQVQPGRHLYLFSPKTLKKLLNATGFDVIDISHSYWIHNYYSLFQSLRIMFSPKFKKKDIGGLAKGGVDEVFKAEKVSPAVKIGKIVAKFVAFSLSIIEPVVSRGEVMTVYAKKSKKI